MSNAVYLSKIAPAGDGTAGQILTSGGANAAAWITILPVANGGTGVTASTGASSVVLRDSNSNVTANSLFEGFTSVAAAGGTTTLTAASTPTYVVTGSGGQTYRLPDATTLPAGAIFSFNNNQTSGTVVVQGSTGTTLATLQSGSFVDFTLLVNSPAAGTWDTHAQAPSNVSWSTNTLDWTGSITSATWNGVAVAPNRGGTGIANNVASTLTISGAYATTLTITGTTGVTLPTSGTLATTANTVASFSAGTTGLTPSTATTGAVTLAGTLVAANGGTGQSSYAVGDILYASTTTALSKLADVATGSVLVSGGVGVAPAYSATPTVTSLTASTSLTSPIYNSSTTLSLQTGGTTGLYINASQNVGIGTTSINTKFHVVSSALADSIRWTDDTNSTGLLGQIAGASTIYTNTSLAFGTGSAIFSEKMRIDTSGNLLVGATSSVNGGSCLYVASGTCYTIWTPLTTSINMIVFRNGNGNVGSISTNGTATAFNTGSDYRLKHDVEPMTTGLATVSALKPVTYKWNADNSNGEGFIAHELQTVIPHAVTGEKDAIGEDGNPIHQGVDYSKIVVHLVAAIKELSAKVTALESK